MWPYATCVPSRWRQPCQTDRHRKRNQLMPRGNQRRAWASSPRHQARVSHDMRSRRVTRPANEQARETARAAYALLANTPDERATLTPVEDLLIPID